MRSRRGTSFAEEGKWTSGADSTMLVGDWQAWVDGEGHWKVRGPDPDDERHYADGDIELSEAEYIEAGNSEARRKIRARRAKEAARSYIKTMTQPSKRHHATRKTSPARLDREIAAALAKRSRSRSHSTMERSPYGHELFKTSTDKPKPEIIARRRTADDKSVLLWNDGTLTWGMYDAIKGSPRARTDAQIREALDAGWLVIGEVELYDADEVPRLIEVARKVARRGGSVSDLRSAFAKAAPLKPHWVVQETDREGRPTVRVWRLPRISHPGIVIWDEVRGSHGSRYRVMTEIMERGRRSGTLADTGVRFKDLTSLSKYLHETSTLR